MGIAGCPTLSWIIYTQVSELGALLCIDKIKRGIEKMPLYSTMVDHFQLVTQS